MSNFADSAMTDVRVLLESSKETARKDQINGLAPEGEPAQWEVRFHPDDLDLECDQDASSAPDAEKAKLWVEFRMESHRFRWTKGEVHPLDERVE